MLLFIGMIVCLFCFPKLSWALESNEVQIDSFKLHIRENAQTEAFPVKNVKVNVYGSKKGEEKAFLLGSTMSNEDGEVTNLRYKAQKNFDQVHFQYMFGNDERGYIIRLTNYKYNANTTRSIPANRKIHTTGIGTISGANGTAAFYVKLTKLNNAYDEVYQKQKLAVEKAKAYIDTSQVSFKPINVIYDIDSDVLGGGFNRNGHGGQVKGPILILSTTDVVDFRAAMAHEWGHWNMYRVNGMPGGSYKTHHDQVNPYVSYKEGWALFQRHQFTCGLENELANETQVQNSSRLFGVSTNYTVKGALYDIYDMNFPKNQLKEKDEFDVYTAFVNGSHAIAEKDLISEGLMYTLMVNSKASTFQEFYTYLMNTHIVNHPDKTLKGKLEQAMKNNGIEKDGNFAYPTLKATVNSLDTEDEAMDTEEH